MSNQKTSKGERRFTQIGLPLKEHNALQAEADAVGGTRCGIIKKAIRPIIARRLGKKGFSEMGVMITIAVVFAVCAIILGIFSFHMESKTYNKLTGANTTWWDAAWVELRVQDQPK